MKLILQILFIVFSSQLMANTNDMIIFYHIRKCGGTTVFTLLEKKFYHNQVHASNDLTDVDFEKIKFLRGHLEFNATYPLFPNAKNITFLRNPVSRIVSSYKYWLENYSTWPKEKQERTFPLLESNVAVKALSSYNSQDPTISIERHLESAKDNLLHNFFFVGITEEMSNSLTALSIFFGWQPENHIPILNTSRTHYNCPTEVVEEIKKRNLADIELYEFAKKILQSELIASKTMKLLPQEMIPQRKIHYTFDQPLDGEGWGFREGF